MSKCEIIIIDNPFDETSYKRFESDSLVDFLVEHYGRWPSNARLFKNQVAVENDITPSKDDNNAHSMIDSAEGTFYVVHYPEGGMNPLAYLAIPFGITAIAATAISKPKIPSITSRNIKTESPNNGLGDRQNTTRINGRIADIYGTVSATPDLIALPYKVFENQYEVEYTYMCLGKGEYHIEPDQIYDDTTPIAYIQGATVEIYAPYTKPIANEPVMRVGNAITRPIQSIASTNSVNGQTLRPPNSVQINGSSNISFIDNNIINVNNADIDVSDYFEIGDSLIVIDAIIVDDSVIESHQAFFVEESTYGWFRIPSTGETELPGEWIAGRRVRVNNFVVYENGESESQEFDLSGFYEILQVVHEQDGVDWYWKIQLGIYYVEEPFPMYVNKNWINSNLNDTFETLTAIDFKIYTEDAVFYDDTYQIANIDTQNIIVTGSPFSIDASNLSSTLLVSGYHPIGSFIMSKKDTTRILANFVALNGLYKDDGKKQYRTDVEVALFVEKLDSGGSVIWSDTFNATVIGSSTSRATRAITLDTGTIDSGRYRVSAYRVTGTDTGFNGSIVDEVKWRDCYACSDVDKEHFGNVTTVYARTLATGTALAVSNRKINMLATRKIPLRISGSTFTTELYPTNRADHILCALCHDPYIGNRTAPYMDYDNIYDTLAEVEEYFGIPEAAEFCYTFDNTDLSFEETIRVLAESVFCTGYSQGAQIKLSFERKNDDPEILFNSMNKIPKSETRTPRFGNENSYDGIQYKWIDPDEDYTESIIYLPEPYNAVKPNEIESVGVCNYKQAYLHAWREWQKIQFRNISVEFQAGHEAELLVTSACILVADNTRTGTQDGEILEQNGLVLTLSDPCTLDSEKTYGIWLQHYDGSTENIEISAGSDKYHVVLNSTPRLQLITESEKYARTTYWIVAEDNTREMKFLVSERSPEGKMISSISAYNYSEKYYEHDKDFT